MNPLGIILPWWVKPASIIALGLIIFCTGYYRGYQSEKTRYDAFVQEVELNKRVAEVRNKEIEKKQQEVTKNVVDQYAKSVDQINSYYKSHPRVVQLRDNSASCGVSEAGSGSKGTGGQAGGTVETPAITIDLKQAGIEVERCIKLMEWEKAQEEIK